MLRLIRGIRTVGAKNLKKKIEKCAITDHRRPPFGPTRSPARQPDELDRIRDDVGKKLGQCDRRRISANFLRPKWSISFDWTFDKSANEASRQETISIKLYVT